MNYKRIILLSALFLTVQPVMAANDTLIPADVRDYLGYGLISITLLLFIAVLLVMLKTFRILTRVVFKYQGTTEEAIIAAEKEEKAAKKIVKPKVEVWNKLLSLRPLEEEKDLLIAHDYDGIQELDNPIPAWFMYLFYGTIIFGICYLLTYHVFGLGQLQYDEYKTEMAQADVAKKEYLSKAANLVDENSVKSSSDPAVISAGQAIFTLRCAPCHGDHGQGNVGPNLTDDYWLHGSKINDLFKTIKYGVLAKGMPTWEKQLSPRQIADVANFVKSIHDTHPAGAKAPQGVLEKEESNKPASK
ncbi:cytochrome c oxidase cbb3-type subunit 3 [Mucilaginibacter gracilis]|uniref:Cytochrome c oxidase cbb3-type subunit 3 n=1 Tax=Mucilaginibacter gracilis TaxID=423350 RepID=A0A495J422_9SPHI|nr:cbb3-type cytochrome c oxidase N-terminal domain-containing protein [Mucilaginibacter gracilis]RKR83573.1 cytochrome c oxidase cbb3-type subunit 3 [Mucilaginibacter gracilis]